ncbi:hypothetical protein ABEB36_013910 [Hypothenemus hampei]|uniref:Threonylcarbamoyl-AMP synthase n=1 Tax=Hypothenemus hampei TaxID=57062 RepID=A0ABD1E5N6_HYPHA
MSKFKQLIEQIMAKRVSIHQEDSIGIAVQLLKAGKVIAVPTDTLYGLACDATNIQAVTSMYHVKQRNEHKPVALCFGEVFQLESWVLVNHLPKNLLKSILPGPVTLLLNSNKNVHKYICRDGKIGVRVPNYQFIRQLTVKLGSPVALTSANLSSEPSAVSCEEFPAIWNKIPAVFDGGVTNIIS